jgi:hypothetical protein
MNQLFTATCKRQNILPSNDPNLEHAVVHSEIFQVVLYMHAE